jgi:hypothetical protein
MALQLVVCNSSLANWLPMYKLPRGCETLKSGLFLGPIAGYQHVGKYLPLAESVIGWAFGWDDHARLRYQMLDCH